MSMIRHKLEEEKDNDISIIWFNTWQFSQFNMGDTLPLMMMSKLVNAVCDNKNTKLKENAEKLISTLGDVFLGRLSGGTASMDSLKSQDSLTDVIDKIENLRDTFQSMVKQKVSEDGRVVIFIDDLDRLEPGRAVELLEILKVFLDCERCVFVLAIDYGVVCRGVKEKYGADFNEEKGKSFFDKIIQVPFKMPVADYDISNYIKQNFEKMGIIIDDDRLLESYVCVINDSIGNNPRSMKRLFNSFLLLSKIAQENIIDEPQAKEILFALLCMQSKYEDVYNYLIKNKEKISFEDINSWKDNTEKDIYELIGTENESREQFRKFMESFIDIVDSNDDHVINSEEMERFKKVLGFSTITANNATVSDNNENEYRWRHKEKVRSILDVLKPDYESLDLTDWYTRTHEKGTWWGYTKNTYKTSTGLEYACEFRFDPAGIGTELMSVMTVNIYHRGGKEHSIDEVLNEIGKNPLDFLGDPVTENNGYRISYKNVEIFRTDSDEKDADIISLLRKVFNALN